MDTKEIQELYIKYGPMVLRRCRFMLRSEDSALDAMQEVFVKLIANKKHLTLQFPSALLYKIATNVCLNLIKAGKKESYVDTGGASEIISRIASTENFVDKIISNDLIEKLFRHEPVSTKEIAVMHFVDGLTLNETAKECGLSVSGVRKRLDKFRKKIQDQKNMVIDYE